MGTREQAFERRHRDFRRAEEDDSQGRQGLALGRDLLLALFDVEAALQAADAIDEENAVEMIDFMLDTDGAQTLGMFLDRVAVEIVAAERDRFVAFDGGVVVGNRETALVPGDASRAFADFRVQDDRRFIPFTEELLEELIRLYEASQREVRPHGGRMPVLFMPHGSLLTLFYRIQIGTSAESLLRGISPLGDRVGERIVSERITIVDDPRDPRVEAPRSFDDEGVACDRFPVIENGVFRGFHNDLETASRLGVAPTGHGARADWWREDPVTNRPRPALRHLCVEPGNDSLAELIRAMGRGLVLEGQMGAHSGNIAHGDYSVGVNPGFWVENGEIVGRVKDAMVSGNVYETLRNVIAIGKRRDHAAGGRVPPILCDDVRVVCG